jgi:C-terminal processing protease CtpA/Prc
VFRAVLGGQTPALRRAKVRGSGAWPSVALFGFGPSYDVRYIDGGGTEHVVSLEATVSPPRTTNAPASAPYTYTTLRDGSVGYIDYRSCVDLAAFKTFLGQTFASIQAGHVKALIIDVRNNGGGDSDLNDVLWTYVTTKPFKQFGGGIVKACDRLKREYGHAKYVDIYGEGAWKAPDGTLLTSGGDPNADLVKPGRQPLRFTGPTYLLTSALTFSSAMSCALAAKDYGLATIVGEETGEPVNSTGEVYSFVTPAVGFTAYLTTKYFFAPKPHPDGQGVVPDIPVETSTADVAAGRDPVIARVFAAIDGAARNGG